MERENILVILYEMAMAIGGETRLKPLLTRTLQRLLYHTSFPAGFVCLDLPPPAPGEDAVEVRLDAVVGDFELMGLAERPVRLPAALLRGEALRAEDAALLARLPGVPGRYRAFLRLPLDGHGVIVLLAPRMPETELPLTSLFQPVMANLAKAIVLCRHHEAYTAGLVAERDRAWEALRHSEDSLKEAQRIAHLGNWDLDLKRSVLTWSDEIYRIFEIDPAKFGASYEAFLDAIHPDDRELVNRAYTESVRNRTPYDIVHRLRMKDGRIKFVHERCESFYDEAGTPLRSVGTVQDVTERMLIERRLRDGLERTVEAIAATIELRDPYTAGHERRVVELTTAIAREMGLAGERIEGLRFAALVHDIGKIRIPAEILSKPAALSPIEFEMIKTHCQTGHDILKGIEFPWPVARIVLEHHERLDGSGYPGGLKGAQTLLESKILTVADTVEAMASHRPYRPALGIDAALAEIERHRGARYDPAVVDACLRLFRERGFRFG